MIFNEYVFRKNLYQHFIDHGFQNIEQFSVEQIEQRLALLDEIMEIELREVQNRFQSKRKPILEAIKLKKQTQNHH